MKILRHCISWGVLLGLWSLPALAGTRIESLYVPGPNLSLQSRWLVPDARATTDAAQANLFVAESAFTEMLLTIPAEYIGKNVQIFLIMPPQIPGVIGPAGMEVEWRTQGVFLPGKARPGERVLLFQGVIRQSPLRDLIAYTFRVDARYNNGQIRFDPFYEIEQR
ncbi:MAG TPA: hypothetical protein VEI74_11150 [Candidatus Methylomirabilis sp.]|nr:hypothetical protein [Candidatus Methylomirabilis sp.]